MTEKLITELTPHPLNKKLYGAKELPKDFLESVKAHGILEPVVYANYEGKCLIISGHRRWQAAKVLGLGVVPVRLDRSHESYHESCHGTPLTDLHVEERLIESNRQRVKTAEQKAREFKELKRIAAALIKERESRRKKTRAELDKKPFPENCILGDAVLLQKGKGLFKLVTFSGMTETCAYASHDSRNPKPLDGGRFRLLDLAAWNLQMIRKATTEDLRCFNFNDYTKGPQQMDLRESLNRVERNKTTKAKLPESSPKPEQGRDSAAKAVGMKPRTAEKVEKVVDAADAGDTKAREALDAVNAGTKSINAAYKMVAPQKSAEQRRRDGFRKENPEYADKTDAEVDAAIVAKYGNAPAGLRKSESPRVQDKNGDLCQDCVIALNNGRGFCDKHKVLVREKSEKFPSGGSEVNPKVPPSVGGSTPTPSLQILPKKSAADVLSKVIAVVENMTAKLSDADRNFVYEGLQVHFEKSIDKETVNA